MEVLLPNCTASFFSLSLQPNPVMTTTTTTDATTAAAAAAAAATTIFLILPSLTYYTLTSTATSTTLAPNSRYTIFNSSSTHGNHIYLHQHLFFLPTHCWLHYSFQISRLLFSNLPPSFIPTAIFFFQTYRHLSNIPPSSQTHRRRGGRSRD